MSDEHLEWSVIDLADQLRDVSQRHDVQICIDTAEGCDYEVARDVGTLNWILIAVIRLEEPRETRADELAVFFVRPEAVFPIRVGGAPCLGYVSPTCGQIGSFVRLVDDTWDARVARAAHILQPVGVCLAGSADWWRFEMLVHAVADKEQAEEAHEESGRGMTYAARALVIGQSRSCHA